MDVIELFGKVPFVLSVLDYEAAVWRDPKRFISFLFSNDKRGITEAAEWHSDLCQEFEQMGITSLVEVNLLSNKRVLGLTKVYCPDSSTNWVISSLPGET